MVFGRTLKRNLCRSGHSPSLDSATAGFAWIEPAVAGYLRCLVLVGARGQA